MCSALPLQGGGEELENTIAAFENFAVSQSCIDGFQIPQDQV